MIGGRSTRLRRRADGLLNKSAGLGGTLTLVASLVVVVVIAIVVAEVERSLSVVDEAVVVVLVVLVVASAEGAVDIVAISDLTTGSSDSACDTPLDVALANDVIDDTPEFKVIRRQSKLQTKKH